MKKENCPFCGHRWIRKSMEEQILCPNCNTEYFVKPQKDESLFEDEIREQEFEQEEEKLGEELDEKTR
jgi:predicted  nucleic acid-binding Zn-ribbon protein